MWRAVKRGYSAEPALIVIAFALSLLAALPDALLPWLLMKLANGLLGGEASDVYIAAFGLAFAATATWVLSIVSDRTQRRFRDRVAIALESHVAALQASVATVEHHERPDYLDRLAILRNQVFVLDHMYMALFSTCGWILRLGVAVAWLMSVHPALAVLVLFALPTVVSSSWRPAVERAAEQAGAQSERLARHLFDTATTAPPGKEVRVTGIVRTAGARTARGVEPLVRGRGEGEVGQRGLAHPRLGGLRRWLRGRGGLRRLRTLRFARRSAAGAGGWRAPLRLHQRHGGGNRLPARHLDGRLQAHGVAGRLRRGQGGAG